MQRLTFLLAVLVVAPSFASESQREYEDSALGSLDGVWEQVAEEYNGLPCKSTTPWRLAFTGGRVSDQGSKVNCLVTRDNGLDRLEWVRFAGLEAGAPCYSRHKFLFRVEDNTLYLAFFSFATTYPTSFKDKYLHISRFRRLKTDQP
jgi:hypothetical protein